MSFTRTQIISMALTQLGQKPILSLNNQSDLVTAMDQSFDMLVQANISERFWRFATTIYQLAQVVPQPIGGYWTYAYKLPAGFLKLVHLWPILYDFEIYENQLLYSNYNNINAPLFIEYTFYPPVVNFPDYYVKYLVYELAAWASLSNAIQAQYYDRLSAKAGFELAVAQAADAQNRPQTQLMSQPMITRRYVTTFSCGG